MAMEFGTYGTDVGRRRRTDRLPVVRYGRRLAGRMFGIVDVVVTSVSKKCEYLVMHAKSLKSNDDYLYTLTCPACSLDWQ